MKTITLAITTFFSTGIYHVNAQETKLKTETKTFLGVDLNFKRDDQSLKQSSFTISDSKTRNTLVKGAYKNDTPAGNWYFYNDQNKLETCYNQNQKKLIFLDTAIISSNQVTIKSTDQNIVEKSSIPVLLYPKDLYIRAMLSDFAEQIPADSSCFHVEIIAEINSPQDVSYNLRYFVNGKETQQKVKLKELPFNIQWLPAMFNNEVIPSSVSSKYVLTGLIKEEVNEKRFRWDIKN